MKKLCKHGCCDYVVSSLFFKGRIIDTKYRCDKCGDLIDDMEFRLLLKRHNNNKIKEILT